MAPILMSWTSHVRAAAPSYPVHREIGLIICSRQPRFISIRDTAPFIWTWFSSTAASDADIHQRLKLLPYVRHAKHFFRGEFAHMLENLPRSKKIGHQLVKNKQFTHYESAIMLPICMKMKRCCADCGEAAGDATLVFVDIALTVTVLGKLVHRLVAVLHWAH